jgi:hypothetical protein
MMQQQKPDKQNAIAAAAADATIKPTAEAAVKRCNHYKADAAESNAIAAAAADATTKADAAEANGRRCNHQGRRSRIKRNIAAADATTKADAAKLMQ